MIGSRQLAMVKLQCNSTKLSIIIGYTKHLFVGVVRAVNGTNAIYSATRVSGRHLTLKTFGSTISLTAYFKQINDLC